MIKKIRISVFFVVIILYIIFFGSIIEKESVYVPVWALNREEAPIQGATTEKLIPFKLSNVFGYLDPAGALCFQEQILHDATLNRLCYINYSRLSDTLVLRNTEGDIMESLDTQGYPDFISDRLLVFSVDRTGISEFNTLGDLLWSRSFRALITSIDVSEEYILTGLLNGTLVLLSDQGEPIYSVKPGGSRVEVIYGCACTHNAHRLAAVSGLDPQKLLFIEKKNEVYRVEEILEFEDPVRHPVYMKFSPDGTFLLISIENRTWLYSVEDGKMLEYSNEGVLSGIHLNNPGVLSSFLFSRGNARAMLSIAELGGTFRDDIPVPAGSVYLESLEDMFLLNIDEYVIRIDREEK